MTSEEGPYLEKALTGITGFDDMTGGGLPRNYISLFVGGPGSGKTMMALQTLVNGARHHDEPGIFVAFEENSRRIVANAASFGWDISALEERRLFFLDARMVPDVIEAGRFDLKGMLAGLEAKIAEMGAQRIVFDSIDVLLSLLDDPGAERRELYRLLHWLSERKITAIITAKSGGVGVDEDDQIRHYGFLQFMVDCVILLSHRVHNHTSLRHLRVVKYRGSGFVEDETPMIIGPRGIEVNSIDELDFEYPAPQERIPTGIAELDLMMNDGYYRGSSVLITGAPGTAKTTLGGAFAEAACQRGERVLYVSFDEAGSEIVRNLASVDIQLRPHLQSGLLKMVSIRSEARSAEGQLLRIRSLVDEYNPHCLVIDPLSAIINAGIDLEARQVAQRLLYHTKARGTTTLCTSLLETNATNAEASPLQVSTIADTWIHLSYQTQGGERNRALSIVKARGTGHSNQVRELLLSDDGVSLADVYSAGGEVLMGTLRWEKEHTEQLAREQMLREMAHRRRELQALETETQARIEALQAELVRRRAELDRLELETAIRQAQWQSAEQERIRRRSGNHEEEM